MFAHEIFKSLVIEYKLVSFEYFMNELECWEAIELIDKIAYADKNLQLLLRYNIWVAVQSNSKKQVKVEEIISLPWDNKVPTGIDVSEKDRKKLQKEADKLAAMLFNNTNTSDNT